VSIQKRATAVANGATPVTLTLASGTAVTPTTLLLVGVALTVQTNTVASMVPSIGTGTFTQLFSVAGTSRALAVWMGYGFSTTNKTLTIITSADAMAVSALQLDTHSGFGSAPTVAANAGSTGTSTTPDSGLVTGITVGDIVVTAAAWAHTTAASARTGVGGGFDEISTSYSTTATRISLSYREATVTSDHSQSWTITSGAWAAGGARITLPAAAAAATGWVYKGRVLSTQDTAAAA